MSTPLTIRPPPPPTIRQVRVEEIKKRDSKIRVIFATTALGMGVDSPYVENIIHISPANIESYMQETGRAGRNGKEACAILYYNESDISANKVHVEESMKNYCKSENTCFRKIMLNHFGFPNVKQVRCCSRCDKKSVALQLEDVSFKEVFKSFKEEEKLILYHTIEESLTKWQERIPDFGVYTFT